MELVNQLYQEFLKDVAELGFVDGVYMYLICALVFKITDGYYKSKSTKVNKAAKRQRFEDRIADFEFENRAYELASFSFSMTCPDGLRRAGYLLSLKVARSERRSTL
ncbi:hypothetical protein CRN61_17810 [Vibrio vulnificus]|uniref:hypothetical protein n=1 Tax=Vibrio vulnificus TaxID=672 RepID=UPI000C9DC1ED|nr:hypothetical protein [Vibrio vulnificus]PNG65002.1 hypothetical protein SC81_07750 [Vibrio vulnificus]POC08135.1 hypothetical protein CRN54_16590 [Vibrio vulnificus]POC78048.1 hypothetical protein CRN61_17810 [Vibrio vulnificus]